MALIGGVLIAAVVGELAVRVLGLGEPVYVPRRFEPGGKVPFARIPDGPITYLPNTTFASVYDPAGDARGYFGPEGRVTYRINGDGMRGPSVSVQKPPGTYRIVCLGDSLTFGEGVKYPDTYPARLRTNLAAGWPDRRVEVLNAGVQAYGTVDARVYYELRCGQFQPDVVTIGFFLNDATDGAETIRQNEERTKEWKLSPLANVSRIWEIVERSRHAARLQDEYFETTRSSFQSNHWERCKSALRDMRRFSERRRFRFVVVVFPVFWGLDGNYPFEDIHNLIASLCRDEGLEHLDLLNTYRGLSASSLWVHPTDHHPNELAHALAATRIADHLINLSNNQRNREQPDIP